MDEYVFLLRFNVISEVVFNLFIGFCHRFVMPKITHVYVMLLKVMDEAPMIAVLKKIMASNLFKLIPEFLKVLLADTMSFDQINLVEDIFSNDVGMPIFVAAFEDRPTFTEENPYISLLD
jgi:hypothetical protein